MVALGLSPMHLAACNVTQFALLCVNRVSNKLSNSWVIEREGREKGEERERESPRTTCPCNNDDKASLTGKRRASTMTSNWRRKEESWVRSSSQSWPFLQVGAKEAFFFSFLPLHPISALSFPFSVHPPEQSQKHLPARYLEREGERRGGHQAGRQVREVHCMKSSGAAVQDKVSYWTRSGQFVGPGSRTPFNSFNPCKCSKISQRSGLRMNKLILVSGSTHSTRVAP